jgi:hypothetical protein
MDRQAHTGDTILVKSREMTGRAQALPRWLGGENEKVKTTEIKTHWPVDIKSKHRVQNNEAPLRFPIS